MNRTSHHSPRKFRLQSCPDCGADIRGTGLACPLCGASVIRAVEAGETSAPPFDATLVQGGLLVGLVVVLGVGLMYVAPATGLFVAIIALPALVRTSVWFGRERGRGRSPSLLEASGDYFESAALILSAVGAGILAVMIAFLAGCFVAIGADGWLGISLDLRQVLGVSLGIGLVTAVVAMGANWSRRGKLPDVPASTVRCRRCGMTLFGAARRCPMCLTPSLNEPPAS